MKYIYFALLLVLLSSCGQTRNISKKDDFKTSSKNVQIFSGSGFVFEYPKELIYKINRDDGSIALSTTNKLTSKFSVNDYFIEVDTNSKNINCDSEHLGVSKTNKSVLLNSGKVDYFDLYGNDFDTDKFPECRPLVGGSAYAFCSEDKNKKVLICIAQKSDNPELAQKIFSSFKWIEE